MDSSGVQVLIPAALIRPTHTLYSICVMVQPTLQEWTVNRRYSQFLQLQHDLITTLGKPTACPGCVSFHLALRAFPFPKKTWIRTNRIVRKRVKALQAFVELIVERLYNDRPKCTTCGEKVKKMTRPFLIRGAQPMCGSTMDKIQGSLSLSSYALIRHPTPSVYNKSIDTDVMMEPRSPTDVSQPPPISISSIRSQDSSEDSYTAKYGGEQCTDAKVDLKTALQSVVLAEGRQSTVEEVATRLSSMWSAYDLRETLRAVQDEALKLSVTMEDDDHSSFDSEVEEMMAHAA